MVAYRGATSTNSGSGTTNNLSVNLSSASAAEGDFAIVVGGWNLNGGTLTGPTDWTAETQQNISTTLTSGCWTRVLTSGDISTDSITVSSSSAGRCSIALIVVSAPGDRETPTTTNQSANDTTQPTAAIDPSVTALTLVVMAVNCATTGATDICTAPSGWTERTDTLSTNASGRELGAFAMTYDTIDASAVSANTVTTSANAHSASWTWSIQEAGAGPNEGIASGTVTWAGAATGARASEGTASGTVTWSGAASGARASSGSASGSVTWAGAATGSAPSGVSEGTAAGAISWSGAATGARDSEGTASGSVLWSGSATGARDSEGTASGTISWTGAATGEAPVITGPQGQASGTISWVGVATGEAPTIYMFEPPTYRQRLHESYPEPLGYYSTIGSTTVYRSGGGWTDQRSPSTETLRATGVEGEDWFRGGHIYRVTAELAAELDAAGYPTYTS